MPAFGLVACDAVSAVRAHRGIVIVFGNTRVTTVVVRDAGFKKADFDSWTLNGR